MKYILAVISIIFFVSGCSSSEPQKPTMQKIDETKEKTNLFLVYSEYKKVTHNGEVLDNYNSKYSLLTLNQNANITTKEYLLSVDKKQNKFSDNYLKDSALISVDFNGILGSVKNNEYVAFNNKLNKENKLKIENKSKVSLYDNYMLKTYSRKSTSINRQTNTIVSVYIYQINEKDTHRRALTSFCFQGERFEMAALKCVDQNNMGLF
tara:strand:+ start:1226 stop:1849 length:624 start_codon:yes stop_codon:yes gene_type:complete